MSSNDFGMGRRLDEIEAMMGRPAWSWSSRTTVARVRARAIEMYRAALALIGGDPADTIARAGRAVAASPPGMT